MKIFTQAILARRKIVLIFLLAILLPSLIVGYLNFRTFSQRREAVKRLLESNLWTSGEAALNSIENFLLEHEKEALKPENFLQFTSINNNEHWLSKYLVLSEEVKGQLFLLDDNFQLVIPKTGGVGGSSLQWEKNLSNTSFAQDLQRAEFYEFSQRNYSRAADLYRKCTSNAATRQYEALALEAYGRCLLHLGNYKGAYKVYNDLSDRYSQLQNKAGHPYGIIAALQLFEIQRLQKKEEQSIEVLIDTYKKIQLGAWSLNLASYDFFMAEIDSILKTQFHEGKFPEIQKSYQALRENQSSYIEALLFADFLKSTVILKMKEKFTFSKTSGEGQPWRLISSRGEDLCLISYSVLPGFQGGQNYHGGLCWDLTALKKGMLPEILKKISLDSSLQIQIIDEEGKDILSGEEKSIQGNSLTLSYRQFPLPWKLLVTQPAFSDLERTARQENFFYGVLLLFIVILMLLGAILIARDISRESEATRLKTEFVHNISHELKTPLTLIRLYGETLQRKANLSGKEKKEAYQIITKESERLSHLINNVLDFSRIEMGKKEFDFKRGNLSHVVQETLESYRYHLEKKGFSICADISSNLPEMSFDGEAIASILINLLSNAMKFSPENKEVFVRLFKKDKDAILQVADKGIGIPHKEMTRIFDRFYRSKSDIAPEARGSGLGLTLVKHIAEAHGGRVEVKSELGKGSVFSVVLPLYSLKEG